MGSRPDPREGGAEDGSAGRVLDLCSRFLLLVAGGLVAWLVISISFAVLSRRGFGMPAAWTLELAEYALVFVTFLGLAAVTRDREHVVVTVVNEANFPTLSRLCDIAAAVIGLLIAVSFLLISAYVTWNSYFAGTRMIRILPIERWVIFIAMPIGALFWSIEQARQLGQAWRRRPRGPRGLAG